MAEAIQTAFQAWLSKRTPAVRERIIRLNPVLRDGERIRGYHPHRRAGDYYSPRISKGQFIQKYGREAWAQLPSWAINHDEHRKNVNYEFERDMFWTLPKDHPMRRARRIGKGRNAEWLIPEK